jgi:hypothetical protein
MLEEFDKRVLDDAKKREEEEGKRVELTAFHSFLLTVGI